MSRIFAAIVLALVLGAGILLTPASSRAATAAEIDRDSRAALASLYAESPAAKEMGEKARAILVFPNIIKGGLIIGGQAGDGALFENGETVGYYNTVQVSFGLQFGMQKYGYALFLMTQEALDYIHKSDGFELGVGPSIVVIDKGAASAATTTTLQSDIYAFFFNQSGMMAGMGIQGTKITRINP